MWTFQPMATQLSSENVWVAPIIYFCYFFILIIFWCFSGSYLDHRWWCCVVRWHPPDVDTGADLWCGCFPSDGTTCSYRCVLYGQWGSGDWFPDFPCAWHQVVWGEDRMSIEWNNFQPGYFITFYPQNLCLSWRWVVLICGTMVHCNSTWNHSPPPWHTMYALDKDTVIWWV